MLTQKMKYGLKALVTLARERAGEDRALTTEEIARVSGAPKRFLEQILIEIRGAGYVASIRGRRGGYRLAVAPRDLPLSELIRLVEGPMAPLPCLSRRAYRRCEDCLDEATCSLRRVFGQVFASYLSQIDSLTLEDLVRSPVECEGARDAIAATEGARASNLASDAPPGE